MDSRDSRSRNVAYRAFPSRRNSIRQRDDSLISAQPRAILHSRIPDIGIRTNSGAPLETRRGIVYEDGFPRRDFCRDKENGTKCEPEKNVGFYHGWYHGAIRASSVAGSFLRGRFSPLRNGSPPGFTPLPRHRHNGRDNGHVRCRSPPPLRNL